MKSSPSMSTSTGLGVLNLKSCSGLKVTHCVTSSSSAGTRLSTQLLAPSVGPHLIPVGIKLSVSSWERKSPIQSLLGGNRGQRARDSKLRVWFRRCFPRATPFLLPCSVPCGNVQKTEQPCQKYLTVFQELSLHSL